MKRAKKRYVVKIKNDMAPGIWRDYGTYVKRDKAEHDIEMSKLRDRNDVMYGYTDLHTEYKIEEITIY